MQQQSSASTPQSPEGADELQCLLAASMVQGTSSAVTKDFSEGQVGQQGLRPTEPNAALDASWEEIEITDARGLGRFLLPLVHEQIIKKTSVPFQECVYDWRAGFPVPAEPPSDNTILVLYLEHMGKQINIVDVLVKHAGFADGTLQRCFIEVFKKQTLKVPNTEVRQRYRIEYPLRFRPRG